MQLCPICGKAALTDEGCSGGCDPKLVVEALKTAIRASKYQAAAARKKRREEDPDFETLIQKQEMQLQMKCTRRDRYPDWSPGLAFYVVRFDPTEGEKTFRPIHQAEGARWRVGDPPGQLPLYRDPGGAERVVVFEGEKCAEIGGELVPQGAVATTTAHGASSPHLTDLAPLEGADEVFVWPDQGAPGQGYLRNFVAAFGRPVYVIRPDGLEDGADVEQWRDRGGTTEQFEQLMDAARTAGPYEPPAEPVVRRHELNGEVPTRARLQGIAFEKLVDILGGKLSSDGRTAKARCPHPSHPDARASLHIFTKQNGQPTFKCMSQQCDFGEICEAAGISAATGLVSPPPLPWKPFPLAEMPEPFRTFIDEGAKATGVDAAMYAVPVLGAVAGAIGRSRVLEIKGSWDEQPVVWAAVIAKSGERKSPPFRHALAPHVKLQAEERDRWTAELADYERTVDEWKKEKRHEGDPPERPICRRVLVGDTTIEALISIHAENPRGLLVYRDELAALVNFDRYRRNGGGEAAEWIQMWQGGSISVDRKTGQRYIYVKRAAVSLLGTIQPGVLTEVLTKRFFQSGFVARLLMVCPPPQPHRWTEDEIDPDTREMYESAINGLCNFKLDDDDGPCVVKMTPEAKKIAIEWYNETSGKRIDEEKDDDLKAAYSKIEAYGYRLALMHHLMRCASKPPKNPLVVDVVSMRAGICLAEWFAYQTHRTYQTFRRPDVDDLVILYEWIEKRGGTASIRDIQRYCPGYKTAHEVEMACGRLVARNWGDYEFTQPGPKGGRPMTRFRVCTQVEE